MGNKNQVVKNNLIENKEELNEETSKSLRLKKVIKEKLSKFESKYDKLKIFQQKPHIHFEILLIGFIFTIIFLIFGMVLLFSPDFITKGYAIPQEQFFSSSVGITSYDDPSNFIKTYGFNFGLYHYIFQIEPVQGSSITALINNHDGIARILGTFIGPNLNWYGICYVIFEFFILGFVISSFIVFARYNSFLKYTQDGYKIKRYFTASYVLIIVFIVLSGIITEVNVIPGSAIIETLLMKYDPSLVWPPLHNISSSSTSSSSSTINPKEIEKYINDLSPNGVGVSFPIAVFARVKVRIIQEAGINNDQPAFYFNIYTAWYCWIVFGLYLAFMITLVWFLVRLNKKYHQHKEVLSKLCDMSITDNLFKDQELNQNKQQLLNV